MNGLRPLERPEGLQRRNLMKTEARLDELKMQTTLSTLWLVTLLNVLFRDIHEFVRPGFIEEVMARTASGAGLPEVAFLGFAVVLEIPIMMVLMARVLPRQANSWVNLIAAPFMIIFVLSGLFIDRPADLDDVFHAAVEILLLTFIIWLAWRWQSASRQAPKLKPSGELS
jgi:hypothetical protein